MLPRKFNFHSFTSFDHYALTPVHPKLAWFQRCFHFLFHTNSFYPKLECIYFSSYITSVVMVDDDDVFVVELLLYLSRIQSTVVNEG